jgi:hypothetical protein
LPRTAASNTDAAVLVLVVYPGQVANLSGTHADADIESGAPDGAVKAVLVEFPIECEVCVRIARRWMRLGRTCASTLAVGGAGGVAGAFLVTAPNLRADQWLALLLAMQILVVAVWACVWLTAHTLRLGGLFPLFARVGVVWGVLRIVYSIAFFPDRGVAAHSSTWWWLVADGIGWAIIAVVVRELFFQELLEEFPPPRLWGPGAPEPTIAHADGHQKATA